MSLLNNKGKSIMLVSTLFDRINYALRGIDGPPTEGSEEATYWLSVINRKKDEWTYDPNENWSSLFIKNTSRSSCCWDSKL